MNETGHSYASYLALNGKRDLKGRTMTEEERLQSQPNHPFWGERAQQAASKISARVGRELHNQFLDSLPEETETYTNQQFAFLFERVLRAVDQAPLGRPVTVEFLLAGAEKPVPIHPYDKDKPYRPCPTCGRETPAYLFHPVDGFSYHCACGHAWRAEGEQ